MLSLLKMDNVQTTVCHQCQYGLVTPGVDGSPMPAMKPTKFASNSEMMLKRLSLTCPRQHQHQPLEGGRAKNAAFYPLELIEAIVRGMRDTAEQA